MLNVVVFVIGLYRFLVYIFVDCCDSYQIVLIFSLWLQLNVGICYIFTWR